MIFLGVSGNRSSFDGAGSRLALQLPGCGYFWPDPSRSLSSLLVPRVLFVFLSRRLLEWKDSRRVSSRCRRSTHSLKSETKSDISDKSSVTSCCADANFFPINWRSTHFEPRQLTSCLRSLLIVVQRHFCLPRLFALAMHASILFRISFLLTSVGPVVVGRTYTAHSVIY